MGSGIMGVIPIIFTDIDDNKYFNNGFFDNYDKVIEDNKDYYIIKEDILLNNYSEFLYEFYDLIEEEISRDGTFSTFQDSDAENVGNIKSLEEFQEKFSSYERNASVPFVDGGPYSFSTLGCECLKYFIFYAGSYKAILETYETLKHLEKILSKTMKNPLAKSVKFGIYG